MDPLLVNDCETNHETTAITRQQFFKYETLQETLLVSDPHPIIEVILEAMFPVDHHRDYITRPTYLSAVSDMHTAFNLPYVYDYITKLCRKQAEVIRNHENEHVRSGEARHRKYKRLKLGGVQAYDPSSE
jgi:hypothetical protein